MALALILVIIAVIAPTNYVIAKTNTNIALYGLMGGTTEEEIEEETEGWRDQMREQMKEHWNGIENEDWWDEMRNHMEEQWEDLVKDCYNSYTRSGRYGGGCHW